ncbi:AraC family transcriptional regulator [Ruegeria profundi]|uniref:AraC family transcriptional regulator n=1 Tax=Ruegeria profundi TaxID=1685378 RepID=UPI0014701AC9|nr:AraC family transcriptional regulator [Ruegeria profundi]
MDRVFASLDLPLPDALNPDQLLPAVAYYNLLEQMTHHLGDPCFPARAGEYIARSGLPALRDARNASHSLSEFLVRLQIVFRQTVTNAIYEVFSDGARATLSLRRKDVANSATAKVDALNAAAFVTIFRDEFGSDGLDGLTVSLPEPSSMPPDILSARALMRRKAGGMALSFPSDWLLRPIRLHWSGQQQDINGGHDTAGRKSPVTLVEGRIRSKLSSGTVLLADVAADVGIAPRQLQRVLKAQGTSFRHVLLRQRLETSRRLLETTNSPIGAIAVECGFASPQTFSRAFSKAFGETPSKFRATSANSEMKEAAKQKA